MTGQDHSRPLPPLRAIREAQGLGLRKAAQAASIDPAHLSRVERGKATLSVPALARLARVIGMVDPARVLAHYEREQEVSP